MKIQWHLTNMMLIQLYNIWYIIYPTFTCVNRTHHWPASLCSVTYSVQRDVKYALIVRDFLVCTVLFAISPLGLWRGRFFSVSPWRYTRHWERTHTRKKSSPLTAQLSPGWARDLWRILAILPLWPLEPCSQSGRCSSAPARRRSGRVGLSVRALLK